MKSYFLAFCICMTVYGVASIAMLCLMWKQEPWYIALLRIDYPSVLKSKQDSE